MLVLVQKQPAVNLRLNPARCGRGHVRGRGHVSGRGRGHVSGRGRGHVRGRDCLIEIVAVVTKCV